MSASEAAESSCARERPPESSRAREQAGPDDDEAVQYKPRPWVALSSIAIVVGPEDERTSTLLAPGAADFLLDLKPPVHASYLALPERIAPDPRIFSFSYVVAACSSRLLFVATRGHRFRVAYFLSDAHPRSATILPDIPDYLGYRFFPHRSIGLIADPRDDAHYIVAQLHPTDRAPHDTILYYSTATSQWATKRLASALDHELWAPHGALAHAGLLWWIDVAYGMLVCDPFSDSPHLRHVPLPVGCVCDARIPRIPNEFMDKRRIIRPSQGMLRYVEITGYTYLREALYDPPVNPEVCMHTLVSTEGPHHWRYEYTVTFAELWGHHTYTAAGLPVGVVPVLAMVDPNNPYILYFFHDTTLFAVDGLTRQVVGWKEYLVDPTYMDPKFQYSRFIDAWELPPALLEYGPAFLKPYGPASDDESGSERPDDKEISSLMFEMDINNQPDREQASPKSLGMLEDTAQPSESSPDTGGDQADAEP